MRLDLSDIRNVLANVEQLLGGHDGEQLRPVHRRVGQPQRSDIETSALLDDLRLAQEFLQLASAEIAAAGWLIAGREDPRQPRARATANISLVGDMTSRAGTAPKTINLVTRQVSGARASRPAEMPRQGV
jgi:hypothetical protein